MDHFSPLLTQRIDQQGSIASADPQRPRTAALRFKKQTQERLDGTLLHRRKRGVGEKL